MAAYGYRGYPGYGQPGAGYGGPYGAPGNGFPGQAPPRATLGPGAFGGAHPMAGAAPAPAPFPGAVAANMGPPHPAQPPGPLPYGQVPPAAGAQPGVRHTQGPPVSQGQLPEYPAVAPYQPRPAQPAAQPGAFAPAPAAPPSPGRYPINEKQVRSYSNLYSIIATIDVLQQAFAEDGVTEEKRDALLKPLLQQFDTVIKGLQISIPDVERFCDATELSRFYAWPVIINPPEFNRPPAVVAQPAGRIPAEAQGGGSGVVFDASQKLVELLDMCHMEVREPQFFHEKITEIRSMLQSVGAIPGDKRITEFFEKWYQYFRTLRSGEVPISKIGELNLEARECNIWAREWFNRSIHTR